MFFKKKKEHDGEISKKMRSMMDDMLAAAADETLDDEIIEEGRKSIKSKLESLDADYNSQNLAIMKCGMEFMMVAEKRGRDAEKDITMPLLITITKLYKVERDLESVSK